MTPGGGNPAGVSETKDGILKRKDEIMGRKKRNHTDAAALEQEQDGQDQGEEQEGAPDATVLIVNHGPHFFQEARGLVIPVDVKTEVTQDVAERLVNDFKGSPFFNFEIVEA